MRKRLAAFVLSFVFCLGCGPNATYLESGVGGGVLGAGTGALVGVLITNGDIAASAGLGAAIGIPAALALHAIHVAYTKPASQIDHTKEINRNRKKIYSNQKQLEQLRLRARMDEPGDPDESLSEYDYNGPTRGNPFR